MKRLVGRLVFSSDIFGRLGREKSTKIAAKVKTEEKNEKYPRKVEKVTCTFSFLEAKMDPKVDQKRARSRKSASGGGAGSDFYRFLLPSLFGVTPRIDFWRV